MLSSLAALAAGQTQAVNSALVVNVEEPDVELGMGPELADVGMI